LGRPIVFELALRIACSLAVVFALLWGLARLARRPLAGRGGGAVRVLARQQLTRGSAVAVVRVADRALVLGVTDAGVSLLADADPALFEPDAAATSPKLPSPAAPKATTSPKLLQGSALSPDTWRQALAAVRSRRS
jgi:flagellar protein FliO/FliZ